MADAPTLNLKFRLNDAQTDVRVELPPRIEVDAATLSQLIDLLANVRAKMSPAVRADPMNSLPAVGINGAPWVFFAGHKPDAVSFVIAHPGYGWQRFDLSTHDARQLAAHLQSAIDKASPAGSVQ